MVLNLAGQHDDGDMGEDDFTIDLVTNHVTGRSEMAKKHYNHAQYDDKKRNARKGMTAAPQRQGA